MKKKPLQQIPALSRAEWDRQGIGAPDFVFVSGDAYADHPSFGAAIICRVLMDAGFTVAVLAQPDWRSANDFLMFGRPRLGFLVSSGNMDSMVNHYTTAKKRRSEDAYTPGGKAGLRPDRATVVYANRVREAFPHTPVILGGIEASLRRFAHYDYWDDRVRHSILYDAGADLLVYGMGERAIWEIAHALDKGAPVSSLTNIRGTCVRVPDADAALGAVRLPSFTEVSSDKRKYAEAFMTESREHDAVRGRALVQPHEKGALLCNPPQPPLSEAEMDAIYALPYTRRPHPSYTQPIPALKEVSNSITSVRGCFGGCSFCALHFHQGRVVQPRGHASILAEAEGIVRAPGFDGYIHDIGGPTANFRMPACEKQRASGCCAGRQCIGYKPCKNLRVSHADYVSLLRKLRGLPGVKKVFVRSGVRFDYLMYDPDRTFLKELCSYHISGQLKVAPEHVSDRVLQYMNKPPHAVFERFRQAYEAENARIGKKQYLVPYLISSHPGATLSDAIELAQYLKKEGLRPEQVQDFYPTPGTLSTCMYYTGLDPRGMDELFVEKTPEGKAMQRALMQFDFPRNAPLVRKALRKADRDDLIGTGRACLVRSEGAGEMRRKSGENAKIKVDKRKRTR